MLTLLQEFPLCLPPPFSSPLSPTYPFLTFTKLLFMEYAYIFFSYLLQLYPVTSTLGCWPICYMYSCFCFHFVRLFLISCLCNIETSSFTQINWKNILYDRHVLHRHSEGTFENFHLYPSYLKTKQK